MPRTGSNPNHLTQAFNNSIMCLSVFRARQNISQRNAGQRKTASGIPEVPAVVAQAEADAQPAPPPSLSIPTPNKLSAEAIAKEILADKNTEYDLVSREDYNKSHCKLRSSVYELVGVLCLHKTRTCVGWLLFRKVRANCCINAAGLRKFEPRTGTTNFLDHV